MTIPECDSGHANVRMTCLSSTPPPPPDEQMRVIKELNDESQSNLKPGNFYYLISTRWYSRWQRYTGQYVDDFGIDSHSPDLHIDLHNPGPIDNSDLVSTQTPPGFDTPDLIRTLEEGRHYLLLPQLVWNQLFHWYKGGPVLPRQLIGQGASNTFIVEVYPLCLKLTDSRDGSQSVLRLSKKASVLKLYEKVCELKGLQQDKACIWDYFNGQKQCLLVPSEQTLEDAHLQMDQQILLEVKGSGKVSSEIKPSSAGNELAIVPMELSTSSVTIDSSPVIANGYSTRHSSSLHSGSRPSPDDINDRHDGTISVKKKEKGGLAGLQNLGNTCFMNSAVQCLVHTGSLVEYFLQDYSHEINKQNPLGMHGELAVAFGDLLRNIWSAGRTTIAPRVFKGKLARFAPQFSGYNQHDSQELLAFLLDGLHEDLNRVKQKPYIEMKDSDGRPDEEYADECWKNHKARNDSIIVDTCQGQYKSTLICPVCNKISITFDPFMYLTLPLPSTVNRTMTVTVFYGDGSGLPMPYTVTVSKNGCCKDLREALGTACCLGNEESLLLAEVYDHKIYRYLEIPLEPLSSIKDDEHIVAYRVPKKRSGLKRLVMVHQSFEKKLIGSPLVTYLGEEFQTVADLNVAVERIMSPLRRAHVSSCRMDIEEGKGADSQVGDRLEDRLVENDGSSMCNSKLHFQLSVTEERGFGGKQVDDDYVKRSSLIRVTLNWSDREHEQYDVSYLDDLPEVCKSSFSTKKTRQEAVSLFSCLDAFLKEEPLGPDDMWYCPCCKEHRQATKKLDLWRLPEILVIHLKRFSYSRYLKNKLDTFVSFPIRNLDLSKYVKSKSGCDESHTYELYAISNHYGGLGGGHYSAYAKLIEEDRWYHFDDSHVSPVSETEIKTSAAYVLFYRRMKGEAR